MVSRASPKPSARKSARVDRFFPNVSPAARALLAELKVDVQKRGRKALAAARVLRQRHMGSRLPITPRLLKVLPRQARPSVLKADAWVRQGVERLERRTEALLSV